MGRWESVSLDHSRVRCYATDSQVRGGTGAGVLVYMHGPGLDAFMQEMCERLALAGFAAVAPDFYHRQSEPRVDAWTKVEDSEALRDMAEGLRLLMASPRVDSTWIGVVGFCMGGRLAFFSCCELP